MRSPMRWAAVMALCLLTACATAKLLPSRIEEAGYRPIGGLDQWVTVRGDDDRRPLLLLVHGGPADAYSAFAPTYAPYERDFVLVQWDQRGSGRTFERYGTATPEVTLDRIVADGIALAEQLRARFPGRPLVLMGHSWGSVVASGMATKRPNLFSAYVGAGQVASWAAGVQFQFNYLKDAARASGDQAGLAALEAIGRPDPLNITQYFTFTRSLRGRMHASDQAWLMGLKERALAAGESEANIKAAGEGQGFSGAALIETIVRQDLEATATRFEIPYCVIQGRHDVSTPTDPAKAYFDKVTAPRKRFAVIEDAGHFALATHQAAFIEKLKACPGVP